MQRKYPILGEVKDVDGDLWDVRDVRDTRHGFDLYFGTPVNNHGAYRGGLPRLIATKALQDFWEAHRTQGWGFLYDLPAGRTTLKRVRKRLGFNYRDDLTEFWTDRLEELASSSAREFATRYGVDRSVTFERRRRMLGKRARQIGWWRTPKICGILLSNSTLSQVGQSLGISISHAKRLRDQAKQEHTSESAINRLAHELDFAI
ncbi:MAG: hypothetical protein JO210_13025 [Acidobacteriaceae bacterium]|nr:hypothetical protein [Acidobacteriaceae bacterium]